LYCLLHAAVLTLPAGKTASFLMPALSKLDYPPELFLEDLEGPQLLLLVPSFELRVRACLLPVYFHCSNTHRSYVWYCLLHAAVLILPAGKTASFLMPALSKLDYPPELFPEDLEGPQLLLLVPSFELGVQACMLLYKLWGGNISSRTPGDPANMFTYNGPAGIKVRHGWQGL
jgi:hypothetical protein